MKKFLLSLSAAVACMSMSAAVPVLKDLANGSFNVTPDAAYYSNPSTYDANGNLIITGKFKDDFKFNGMDVFGEGVSNAFIVKYDAANAPVWATSLAGSATVTGVGVDAAGNIYVGGVFAGNVDFLSATADGEPSISKTGLKIDGMATDNKSASFIAKYDKDGKVLAVTSFVPEMLPFLAEKSKEENMFGDGFLYTPSGKDLYFGINGIKVEGEKVYVAVEYTGQTTVGDGTFDGAYIDLSGFIYMDAQNVGIFSIDCATLNTSEVVAKMELVGPFNDNTPAVSSPVVAVKDGQVVAGFMLSASDYVNDVKIDMGSYSTTVTPVKGVTDYYVIKDGAVASMKKAASESFIAREGIEDLLINGGKVYMVGTYEADKPAATLSASPVAPAGVSDVFVAEIDLADLSVKQVSANNVDEGEAGYEMVGSAALVDGSIYINTVTGKGIGGSYWFDGSAFSYAPVAATGVAVGKGVLALVASDATKVDYNTYTFEVKQSGIEGIGADFDENAPVEYFNLQGIRVANPENGLYIRRQGNKVEKVIL